MKAHVQAVLRATKLTVHALQQPDGLQDRLPAGADPGARRGASPTCTRSRNRAATCAASPRSRPCAVTGWPCFVGLDDVVVEGARAGAVGWIGGVTNALPKESVALFHAAVRGESQKADTLYKWFLPLLRMDTVLKFVQLIKLVQQEVGMGNERVRGPRLPLAGAEREEALRLIHAALAARPKILMRIRLLGTGTPTPSLKRMSSGYLVETGARKILFDFGPGAYHRLLEAGVKPVQVTDIFFTHLHYDHCLDYIRLLMTRWDQGAGKDPGVERVRAGAHGEDDRLSSSTACSARP